MSSQARSAIIALIIALISVRCSANCLTINNCNGGAPAECYGQSICEVVTNGVRCDGAFSGCSASGGGTTCRSDYTCPSPPFSARWYITCTSSSYCSTDPSAHSITCGWQTLTCQECEDAYLYSYGYLCWQEP